MKNTIEIFQRGGTAKPNTYSKSRAGDLIVYVSYCMGDMWRKKKLGTCEIGLSVR